MKDFLWENENSNLEKKQLNEYILIKNWCLYFHQQYALILLINTSDKYI